MKEKTCGVYSITCMANSKRYVGSSKHIEQRWLEHKSSLRRGIHFNPYLQASWGTHGEASFSFEILEPVCREYLITREIYWIGVINPEYNSKEPDLGREGWTHSEEIRRKMSASHKGRSLSDETRRNMSITRKGKCKSSETKDKMAESAMKRQSSLEVRARISETTKALWSSPEYRRKVSAAIKTAERDPETRVRMSISAKKQWANPKMRAKMIRNSTTAKKAKRTSKLQLAFALWGVE